MALSGSKNFTVTRSDIIAAALRRLGVYDAGEAIPGEETTSAAMALNLMVKEWSARGIDVWLRDEVTLFLQNDTKMYSLGTTHSTLSYNETTTTGDEIAAATVIGVTSSAGMTAADNVGIKLTDNSIHWDTIVSVDSTTQITITTGILTASASGKKVYAYTTKAGRPQKILSAYRRDINNIDTEVRLIGENDYYQQSNKGSSGPPVEMWYQPTLTTGSLYVWPVDGGASWDKIVFSAQFLSDDLDIASNNPEFPVEWANVLVWSLAAELSSEYGIPEREQGRLWTIAEKKLQDLLDFDVENADVSFALDYRR